MKRSILTFCTIIIFTVTANAQYDFAVGVRSGGTSGITVKAITGPTTAVEGILGVWNDGLSVTGLFEKHPNAFDTPGLHWTLGLGGHATFYDNNYRGVAFPGWYGEVNDDIIDDEFGLGIDAIAGLEYKFNNIPLAASISFKPMIEFTSEGTVWFSPDPGVGLKFAF
jgi:hypothetical protein